MVKIGKALNDGTQGFRFRFGSRDGLYRKRSVMSRYGFTRGETTYGLHLGKRSLYLERRDGGRLFWNFPAVSGLTHTWACVKTAYQFLTMEYDMDIASNVKLR